MFERARAWTMRWAHSRRAAAGLFLVSFMEASFFPVPPDVLMAAILMMKAERWAFYAAITTAGSVLGALLGYAIGWGFYESVGGKIAEAYRIAGAIDSLSAAFRANAFLAVFTAAFTFIPFKVFTIAAGVFNAPLWQLVAASVLGRGMRFFALGWLIKRFGARVNGLVYRYFNVFSVVFLAMLAAAVLAAKFRLW